MSIRRKLMLIILLASTAPLLLTCGVLIGYEVLDAREELEAALTTLADVTAWNTTAAVTFRDIRALEHTLAGAKAEPPVVATCVYDKENRLLASYSRGPAQRCPAQPIAIGVTSSGSLLAVARPVTLDSERIGTVSIHASMDALHTRMWHYVRTVGGLLMAALIITLLLSSWLQRIVSSPILGLARAAVIVSSRKDYALRVHKTAEDEVGVLVDAFNTMLEQIDRHASELTRVNRDLLASKDATEKAAEALLQSEKRFRATFDEAPIGIALVDARGHIVEGNRSLERLMGFTRDEFCSRSLAEVTHPDDGARAISRFRELTSGKSSRYQAETRYLTKDGRTVWARLTVSRLHFAANEFLAIAMIEDVTERTQLEQQFRQAQKMEAVGRLAGGIAHDFNNLLTVIKGHSELLLKRLSSENPIYRNLEQVKKAADRAAALVDQLLAFSRKQFNEPKVLDLNALVRDLEGMLQRLIREDIELVATTSPLPACVKADPVQLEQILLNLVVNARDAMPQGGRLVISARSVAVDHAPAGNPDIPSGRYAVLSVQDTGMGMTEDVRSHVFEPFFTTKEVGKGTGLGLSTVYGIVRQANGHVTIDTELGRGSTFTIYLPSSDAADAAAADGNGAGFQVEGGRETILVVEDEELVRTMLCEALRNQGYSVLEGLSGEHAIDTARQFEGHIHLLLTDIVMPVINGRILAEKILQMRPDIKVLFISGYTDELPEPSAAFLRKPFTPDSLAAEIRALLNQPNHNGNKP